MANLNKVMLIGRLTRDPEVRMFSGGGKVAKFGFAVNNRKKNQQTGQFEDDPVFLDVDAFNRGETGRHADLVEQSLRKGSQVFIEGHLKLEQWTTQDGQKRSKISVVVDNFQFLDPRGDGQGGGATRSSYPTRQSAPPPSDFDSGPPDEMGGDTRQMEPPPPGPGDEAIPF
ncbi:MAG: single-stranded DNA-binding protein [Gemmataceae bacterium]|nr:single-stranded DNA-binding protein [Gemmataceae bacterium]